ncbi:hypothetical protein ACFSNO_10485 [Streptomyces cirratus]
MSISQKHNNTYRSTGSGSTMGAPHRTAPHRTAPHTAHRTHPDEEARP